MKKLVRIFDIIIMMPNDENITKMGQKRTVVSLRSDAGL